MVRDSQEYIHAGDIFQIVPSQRFETEYTGDPLTLYRTLRFVNPSPYMFCLKFGGRFALVGSSPEVHVRAMNGRVEIRPIAGTKRRGATDEEDDRNAQVLLADPKERAEHLMLVDLAPQRRGPRRRLRHRGGDRLHDHREVQPRDAHRLERTGELAAGQERLRRDARHLSGRHGERLAEGARDADHQSSSRRANAASTRGAVGYFGFDGNTRLVHRAAHRGAQRRKAYVQAGAGVVADSTPEGEYQECVNKAMGMMAAIDLANSGYHDRRSHAARHR